MSDDNWPHSGEPLMPERPTAQPQPPQSYQAPPPGLPAQPPAPGYGGPVHFQEPAKKRSLWKWLLGMVVLFVLGVGVCTFFVFNAVKGPIDAANDFLAAAEAGDITAVVNLSSTSPDCFGSTARADLEGFLGVVSVSDYYLSSSFVSSNNGSTTGEVAGTIGDGEQKINFLMVKESGDWLVCGLDVE
jgi:hypothetical protein